VLLLGATVILQSASLRETVTALPPAYPWVVFGVGLLLGWRFKRNQLVVALVVLFVAERALGFFPDAGPSSPGRIVPAAIALALPLDLAVLAWLTERSISSLTGRVVLGLILVGEVLAVALLLRPELAHVAQALQHVPVGLPWMKMPQPALVA